MSSVNKCIIVGNLGVAPELRTFQNGGQVCNMRVATSETWKDKTTGERKERTEWVSVAVMNDKLAQLCSQYLAKGSKVYIEGKLQTRKWQDQSGADRYTTEIVVTPFGGEVVFLDKPVGERSERRQEHQPSGGYGGGRPEINDDIPFSPEVR